MLATDADSLERLFTEQIRIVSHAQTDRDEHHATIGLLLLHHYR